MLKEELNVFPKRFGTSARKEDRTLSVYKSSSMKSFREPPLIVSFALAAAQQTISCSPAFTEANKALEHLQKTLENGQHC